MISEWRIQKYLTLPQRTELTKMIGGWLLVDMFDDQTDSYISCAMFDEWARMYGDRAIIHVWWKDATKIWYERKFRGFEEGRSSGKLFANIFDVNGKESSMLFNVGSDISMSVELDTWPNEILFLEHWKVGKGRQ
jgi:hypothetical protein